MSNFCSYSHFFSKNNCELDTVLARTINILTTNEFVKLTMLWTTGPWSFCHDCFSKQEGHKRLLFGGGINGIGSDNVKSVHLTPFLEHHQQLRQPFGKFLLDWRFECGILWWWWFVGFTTFSTILQLYLLEMVCVHTSKPRFHESPMHTLCYCLSLGVSLSSKYSTHSTSSMN